MRAIRLHRFGPATNLVLDDLPDLAPAPGQVRIAVAASGVHLLDTALRRGEAGGPLPLPALPTVPGREVAGTVDLVGAGVDEAWRGRRVVAHLGMVPGGYAEQAVTAVESLHVVPEGTGFADAVALVGTGRTALGVFELAPPTADDVVLVLSAAGGMGWLLVQAARTVGATVVAAARGARRTARVGELGADVVVVDYDRPDWTDLVRARVGGPTLVYDGVGGTLGRAALESTASGGRFVMFGWSAGEPTRVGTADLVERSLTAGWLGQRLRNRPGGIAGLAARSVELGGRGWWQPLVSTYPLAEAAAAHADLEGRRALGKVVLTVGG